MPFNTAAATRSNRERSGTSGIDHLGQHSAKFCTLLLPLCSAALIGVTHHHCSSAACWHPKKNNIIRLHLPRFASTPSGAGEKRFQRAPLSPPRSGSGMKWSSFCPPET